MVDNKLIERLKQLTDDTNVKLQIPLSEQRDLGLQEKEFSLFEEFIIASFKNHTNRYLDEFQKYFEENSLHKGRLLTYIIPTQPKRKPVLVHIYIDVVRNGASVLYEVFAGRSKNVPVESKEYNTNSSMQMDSAIKEIYFKLQELIKANQV